VNCERIMKRNVEFVSAADSVQTAARKMRSANVGFLPVCDPTTRKVIGAVTDRDIAIKVVADACDAGTCISEVLSPDVVACRPADDLGKAEDLMQIHHKSRVMVTDDEGILLGVISLSDIAGHDASNAVKTLSEVSARERRTV
jgi:CBS domain-containing protein